MKLIDVRQWCRDTFHYYVVLTKSIFFILGLILSYKLVEMTFLNILITYLTDAWAEYDLRRAIAVVNLQEGTSAVLLPLFAYAADVRTGRFIMVVFSTGVCIIGLLLNCLAASKADQLNFGLFYPALVLMTLAQSALTVTLQAFLDDQLGPRDPTAVTDDIARRQRRRSRFWWNFLSIVAAIFAIVGPLGRLEFGKLAIVLTTMMGTSFILLLLGTKCYNRADRIPNPFKDVQIVIFRAIANRKLEYPQTPEGLFDNSGGDLHISPRVPWLRWLDRAAIVRGIQQPGRGSPASSVEQVRRAKLLLKMLPLWSCFLAFSLVAASGSTFFFEEAISLAGDDLRPILLFVNLQTLTEFVVAQISYYVLKKLRERKQYKEQKMELVRIGIGMSCSVACCIAAWATAARMRQRRQRGGDKMSVYWLTPQYFLLGVMGGLSEDGLQSFYESQVFESLARFGPPFGEFVMGVGKFMSILCILILSRGRLKWFQTDLDNSRLDRYYILLAVLNFGNVIIYCLVGCWYGDDVFLVEEEAADDEMGTAQLAEDALASRSIIEGQHISRRSLSHRAVSMREESSSGDVITASSSPSSRQEVETPEVPLLPSESTKNSTSKFALLRAVTPFLSLYSKATHGRSESTPLKDE